MKKFYRLLLSMMLFAASTNLFAYTVGQIITIGQNTYQVLTASAPDFTLSIIGSSMSGELIIPSTVSDGVDVMFTVTEVGGNESYKSPNVTSVVIPETVTKIKIGSFNDASLNSMYIPKSVVQISHVSGYLWKSAPVFSVDPDNPYFTTISSSPRARPHTSMRWFQRLVEWPLRFQIDIHIHVGTGAATQNADIAHLVIHRTPNRIIVRVAVIDTK